MKTSTLQLSRYLFLFTAAILVVFGAGSFFRINENPNMLGLYAFYAFAMFSDAAFMLICAFLLRQKTRRIYLLAVIVLSLNIVLTIFDQFGFVDLIFLLLNLITLIVLFIARKEFNPA
ncbi:MAG: hypothetical protein Q8K73_07855 [Anaerolineales bacterium]|nr:hypothetical protein [Anaerolineales bacterium]